MLTFAILVHINALGSLKTIFGQKNEQLISLLFNIYVEFLHFVLENFTSMLPHAHLKYFEACLKKILCKRKNS